MALKFVADGGDDAIRGPVVGDYVKNKWGTPGTVTRVHEARDGHEDISVRWDDGGTDPLASAKDFLH